MVELVRNILKYTGIFRLAMVEDDEEQKECTKVVIITVGITLPILLPILLFYKII